jgi:hypothetical protein
LVLLLRLLLPAPLLLLLLLPGPAAISLCILCWSMLVLLLLLLLPALLLLLPAVCHPLLLLLAHVPTAVPLLGYSNAWHDRQRSPTTTSSCFHGGAWCVQAAPRLLVLHQHRELCCIKSLHRHFFNTIITRHTNTQCPRSTTSSCCSR